MTRYGPGDVGFFDRVAGVYDRLMPSAGRGVLEAGLRFADRPVRRVVDVAGGTGRAARVIRAAGSDRSVVVCDASAGMVERAGDNGFEAIRCDARRLPFRSGSVDAVVTTDALHHVPGPATALAESVRVLAPGGVVVVREFDPGTLPGRLLAVGERVVGMGSAFLPPGVVVRELRAAGARAYLLDSGVTYTVVGVRPRTASVGDDRGGTAVTSESRTPDERIGGP